LALLRHIGAITVTIVITYIIIIMFQYHWLIIGCYWHCYNYHAGHYRAWLIRTLALLALVGIAALRHWSLAIVTVIASSHGHCLIRH